MPTRAPCAGPVGAQQSTVCRASAIATPPRQLPITLARRSHPPSPASRPPSPASHPGGPRTTGPYVAAEGHLDFRGEPAQVKVGCVGVVEARRAGGEEGRLGVVHFGGDGLEGRDGERAHAAGELVRDQVRLGRHQADRRRVAGERRARERIHLRAR